MKTLYVLDASGFIYRSYFAIRPMSSREGIVTHALYGFVRSVQKLFKDFPVTHLVAVFDGPKASAERREIYSEYKAHRKETPKDLIDQIALAQKFCELMGIPYLVKEGAEADDVMGSVAKWASEQHGTQVYLCTSDKDMAQMVNDKITLLNTHKENQLLDRAGVKEKYGVYPEQIVDWLAITGDASDNVPGIPGFGPKTATSLLEEFGTLDNILAAGEKMKGSKREALEKGKENALLSQKLVSLKLNVPIPDSETFFEKKEPDLNALIPFYEKMDFHSLLKELPRQTTESHEAATIEVLKTEAELESALKALEKAPELGISLQTVGKEIIALALGSGTAHSYYIRLSKPFLEKVCAFISHFKGSFYGHNLKEQLLCLNGVGLTLEKKSFDTLLAGYLLESQERQPSLEQLSMDYLKRHKKSLEEVLGKGKNAKTFADLSPEEGAGYAAEELFVIHALKAILEKKIEERGMHTLFYEMELPLMSVLSEMELTGTYVDRKELHKLGEHLTTELNDLEKGILALAGEEFNVRSPKQLGVILFEKLGLPAPKKTSTGYSTSADVLEKLATYPIVEKILQFRVLDKLRSTYVESLPEWMDAKTGRIHCTFNQTGTTTGRLATQNPNLQNIPTRTPLGKEIRRAFRPEKEGWSFVSADYSQIELRLLAHFCEDPKLIKAFREGEDIHKATAAEVLGLPPEAITPELRYRAKAVNFGILYGQGSFGLSQNLGISVREASSFIERYFERYTHVRAYLEECKEKVRRTGKAVTLFGRERAIPEMESKNAMIRHAAERLAVNTPLQGTAADLIKMAMLRVHDRLAKEFPHAKLVLQIHDELLLEVPDSEVKGVSKLVKEEMERVAELKVPLVVDVEVGKNWAEC